MDNFLFHCILFIFICDEGIYCKSLTNIEQGDDTDIKIVGGQETTIQMYPYQASLLLMDISLMFYQCGGSIISEDYILTAAHCLVMTVMVFPRIGSTSASSGGIEYASSLFFRHPAFNSQTLDYDVGVVFIPGGMTLDGTNARAISMVNAGNNPLAGETMIITGWGATAENGYATDILRVAEVPAVSRPACSVALNMNITTRMFCAGFEEGGVDSCQGDSGGPVVSTRNNRLAGITSYGIGCARPNLFGVYTRIGNSGVRSFIRMITGV